MAKPLTYNAVLTERVDLTSALATFKIRPDDPITEDPPFLPGQYVTLGLNNEEKPELGSVRRPMSIASAPEESDGLEFYIRYVNHPESDNPLTHLLWKAKEGDPIYMRAKGVGKFTIEDTIGNDDERLKVFVAAGTGLAPFLSVVRSHEMRQENADLSQYAILHGASYPDDLGYRDELLGLAELNNLHYLPTISRPREVDDWTGDVGRVEDFFMPDRLEALESKLGLESGSLRPDRAVIFICGLQGTIGKTIERLIHRGFVPENRKLRRALEVSEDVHANLFFEQYDSTPVIDIKTPEVIEPLRQQLHEALANA